MLVRLEGPSACARLSASKRRVSSLQWQGLEPARVASPARGASARLACLIAGSPISSLAPVRWRQTEPALVCKECTVWSCERGSAYLMGRISLEAAAAVVCEGGPLVVVSLEAVFILGVVGWACGVSRFAALLFDELVERLSNIGGHLGRVSSSGELPSVEFSFN